MFQNFVLLFFVTANLCFVNARKLKTEVSTATVNSMTADPLTTKTAPAFTTSGVFANQSINDNWKKLLDKNVTYRFAKYFPRSGDNATEEKVELNETDVDKATSGGYKSKMGYFPSEVDVKDALSSKHKCSGTLVEDKHVLSTAHCVFKSVVAELAVMAGDTNLLPNQLSSRESRRVQLIAKHPDYLDDANTSLEFNIAVLRLDMPFTRSNYLHPAVIPTTRIGKNSQCFFAGWELGNEGSIEVSIMWYKTGGCLIYNSLAAVYST
ncbi:unnamed protein product [Hermetia illucens]|uniref:Peptidase S1 domain-containing protein n=1 Tax=Hermetia illucens TaxID=343691 RepID=A0A7R8UQ37_HERIL|nr:unnamed protein product [Hermetia illucens]